MFVIGLTQSYYKENGSKQSISDMYVEDLAKRHV